MALILKRLWEQYVYAMTELPDPKTQSWFLTRSTAQPFFISFFYVYLVTEGLPAYMKNRKPYQLNKIMIVYNLFQILASGYIAISAVPTVLKLNPYCSPIDRTSNPESIKIAGLVWTYYMLKIIDLLDTVFIILRKKNKQVTFLHVYHHFGMIFITWVGTKFIPGGHSTYLGFINCIVHVFMYTYYLLSSIYKNSEKILKWKKFITQLQLAQFALLSIIYIIPLCNKDCQFPKFALIFYLPQNFFMLTLFSEFYYSTYWKKTV